MDRKQIVSYGYNRNLRNEIQVPLIKLQGKYLQQHGFKIGTNYMLHIETNKIILELKEE